MDRIVLDPNRAYVCTRTRYTRYTRCTGHNTLNAADKFQNLELNTDCGFHILNFMHAALKNARIPLYDFKARTGRILNDLTKAAQALIASPSDLMTQEQIEDIPQDHVEETPQVPSQETVNNLDQIKHNVSIIHLLDFLKLEMK